jgi:hypothetical protein
MALTPDIYSESQRIEILSALAACDGMPKHAQKRLVEQGVDITWTEIRALREKHAGTYQALAAEISRASEEALTIEYRELARLGQRATRNYLEGLLDRQENGELDYNEQKALPQIIQALAKVQQVSTDKLLSLTGRPTDGGSGNTMLESVEFLVKIGVIEGVKRPAIEPATDGTAEEVS